MMSPLSDAPTGEELREKYGGTWANHPDFPHGDWGRAAMENETRQGYWDWVESSVFSHIEEVDSWNLEDLPEHLDDSDLCPEARDRVKERLEKGE
jgi:hypothetical protein